jgi:hypothetical protein
MRGVVFSTTPDPVYSGGTDDTNGTNGTDSDNDANGEENGDTEDTNDEPAEEGNLTTNPMGTNAAAITFAPHGIIDRFGGFLVSDAVAATSGVFSSTSDASGAEDFVKEGETENGSGYGRFSTRIENLQPGTTYYVRAYAQTATGVYYGNQESFRTADACFVATASFGSILHPGVAILRDFRDSFLLGNATGRWLMASYYAVSPSLAEIIAANDFLRFAVRLLLLPCIGVSWLLLQAGAGSVLLTFAALAVLVGRFAFPVRQTA